MLAIVCAKPYPLSSFLVEYYTEHDIYCFTVESEEEVPSNQKSLFHGYTFMLTQKPKDDGRTGESDVLWYILVMSLCVGM